MAICVPTTTDWSCAPEGFLEELEDGVQDRAEALAWTTLQALSGYRMALCPITVRPCSKRCSEAARTYRVAPIAWGGGSFVPGINYNGAWVNSCGCGPRGDCSCGELQEAMLLGPVGAVTEVTVNGAVLDPSAYRVDNGNRLVRLDGGVWPTCQNMAASLEDIDAETFGVTYYLGLKPDSLADYAAGILAVEYAKACSGNKCALPSGVTQITRQGVSMEVQAGLFPNGYTGIRIVDTWLYSVNPHGLTMRPTISSPDYGTPRMTTFGR
jgi:hypothetical protein